MPPTKPKITISPPLINSSNPWATTSSDLLALHQSPHTGAVTTRTSLWTGFTQSPSTHQYTFFSSSINQSTTTVNTASYAEGRGAVAPGEGSSLNTLGYSPIPFEEYVKMIVRMSQEGFLDREMVKPFIISVTGAAVDVGRYYSFLVGVMNSPDAMYPHDGGKKSSGLDFMMEINLSCPNIVNQPPPAYDGVALEEYISTIGYAKVAASKMYERKIHVGIKTPPYTYQGQFQTLISVLEESMKMEGGCPISFITATNTLGSSLVLTEKYESGLGSVNGSGIGGLAGDALHPIALGNVKIIRGMLDELEELKGIVVIGIGGVRDRDGYKRMRSVGAGVVGVGTALGREGVEVFGKIVGGLGEDDMEI